MKMTLLILILLFFFGSSHISNSDDYEGVLAANKNLVFMSVNSINSDTATTKMKIFPSVATDRVNIELPCSCTEAEISIADITGKIVHEDRDFTVGSDRKGNIDVSELYSGIYFLTVKTTSNVYTEKFAVNK
jgi:hypothetical protein